MAKASLPLRHYVYREAHKGRVVSYHVCNSIAGFAMSVAEYKVGEAGEAVAKYLAELDCKDRNDGIA